MKKRSQVEDKNQEIDPRTRILGLGGKFAVSDSSGQPTVDVFLESGEYEIFSCSNGSKIKTMVTVKLTKY